MKQKISNPWLDPAVKNGKAGANDKSVRPSPYVSIVAGGAQKIDGHIVDETLACISVNGQELATFMCSPTDLDLLALGFMYNEGLVNTIDEVRAIHVSAGDTCVDIWLHDTSFTVPKRKIVTAGCGGGITFDDLSEQHLPLESSYEASPQQISKLMREMHLGAELYHQARGIHTAALSDGDSILVQVEDIGRHNCLDKLAGVLLVNRQSARDHILFCSGRISSEMINKARRLQTPIVCSRTSPTALSVALAETWNIAIVAYVRQNRMRVYSHPERIDGAG